MDKKRFERIIGENYMDKPKPNFFSNPCLSPTNFAYGCGDGSGR